jgi:hypothetical protein
MGTRNKVLVHSIFWSVVFCGVLPSHAIAQQTSENAQLVAELPDSPGATLVKWQQTAAQENSRQSGAPVSDQLLAVQSPSIEARLQGQGRQAQSSQVGPQQVEPQSAQESQASSQKPAGTAAAGAIPVSGIAASQPAGVAIAPAKQRRVRTIVFKDGCYRGSRRSCRIGCSPDPSHTKQASRSSFDSSTRFATRKERV